MAGEKLVCFDFDDTLVNAHFHSILARQKGIPPSQGGPGIQIRQPDGSCHFYLNGQHQGVINKQNSGASLQIINELINTNGLKNPIAIANAIRQAIDNGHKVAITSFTHYPEVAVPTLNAIMKTIEGTMKPPKDVSYYVNQICVVGGYPSNGITGLNKDNSGNYIPNPQFKGKEEHIQAAIWHFNHQPGVQLTRRDAMLVDDSQPNIDIAEKNGRAQKVPPEHNPPLAKNDYVAPIKAHVSTTVRVQNQNVNPNVQTTSNATVTGAKPQTQNNQKSYMGQLPPRATAASVVPRPTPVQAAPVQAASTATTSAPKQQQKAYMGQLPPQPAVAPVASQPAPVQAAPVQAASTATAPVPKPQQKAYMGQLPPQPAVAPVQNQTTVNQSPIPQPTAVTATPVPQPTTANARGPVPQPPSLAATARPLPQPITANARGPVPQPPQSAATTRPLPQPSNAAPVNRPAVTLPPSPVRGPTPLPPTAVPNNYVQFSAATNQPAAVNLPPVPITSNPPPITSNYVRFTAATNQQPTSNAQRAPVIYEQLPPTTPNIQPQPATNQPGISNLPPPFNNPKLVQEASLEDILKTPVTSLKGQYEAFSKQKHAAENHGMLHHFAKSVAKSVSGISKERNQQVNDISQALKAINAAPNLNTLDKAILAYAYLDSTKTEMGSKPSEIKDLCESLKKQIKDTIPGTELHYDNNKFGSQSHAKDIVDKDKNTQPTHHKPK